MSEEMKEEKLSSPLVVHHKQDASYQETASELELSETHEEDSEHTLERHRFRKNKEKSGKKSIILLAFVVILASVFCALYYTGNISFGEKKTTASVTNATSETTTDLVEAYKQTIVIKNTYIFVDGLQVDGINGLQQALKYVDSSETPYRIINEDADGHFLNLEVLPILMELGFYDESTEIEHKNLTGLMAKEELTETTESTQNTVPASKASVKKSE